MRPAILRPAILPALALLLAGCLGGASKNEPSFDDAAPTTIQLACGPPFAVQDDAKRRALLVSPGVANVLARSLEEACPDPILSKLRPGELGYAAAEEYLRRAGHKDCTLERPETRLLGRIQVRYECESYGTGRAAPKAPARR